MLGLLHDSAVVIGSQRCQVIELQRRRCGALGLRLRMFVRLGDESALHPFFLQVDQDILQIVRVVIDPHPASAQKVLDQEGNPLDLDSGGFGMHFAAHTYTERVGYQHRIGPAGCESFLRVSLQRRLIGRTVKLTVIALLEPSFPEQI